MDASSRTKLRLITDTLLEDIASGRLRTGDRVESERQLLKRFGVSLGTAQRALKELEHRGVLVRERGRGTFVRGIGAQVNARYVRFFDTDGRELPVYWHVLAHRKARATRRLALFFRSPEPLVCVERQIDVDGRFALFNEFFLSTDNFRAIASPAGIPDATNLRESLADRLALPTLRVEQFISFERLPARAIAALHYPAQQPGFVMELRGLTVGERPLYLQRIYGTAFDKTSLVIGKDDHGA